MAIGAALKAAREKAGLSVEAVADQLRMRQTLVRGIEADDFAQCGGAVYARGHIRSIARVVGIDATPLIAEFDKQFAQPEISEMLDESPSLLTPEKKLPWNTIVSVAAGVLLVIAGISVFNGSGTSNTATPSVSTTPSQTQTTTTPSTPSPDNSAIAAAPGTVSLVVAAQSGSSWLSVRNDAGEQLYQAILRKGNQMTFTDKTRLRVVLGNAGAVSLTVNGKSLGSPGTEGQVMYFDFTPND